MASLATLSSDLSPDAPIYVPQVPLVRKPAASMFATYVLPPVDVLHPSGFPCALRGPPPVFASPFQARPPLPGFAVPPFLGFPPVPASVVMSPPMPVAHFQMTLPAAATAVKPAAPPQRPRLTASIKDGDNRPPNDARTWRVASGRRQRPKPLLRPRVQQEAQRWLPAPASGTVIVGDRCHRVPSPRSVLAAGTTSEPDSPPVVRPMDNARKAEPRCRPVPPSGSAPAAPLPSLQASGRGSRRRRMFNPGYRLTTLMIRNIPNSFTRKMLMNILDQHCAEENARVPSGGVMSEYDFLYVPFDFKTKANKGYCFVNVTTPEAALRLWQHLHGHKWKVRDSHKTCDVDYAAIQGRKKIVDHFSGSLFPCDTEEFLPVWFVPPRDGARPAIALQHVVGHLKGRRS